MRAKLYISAAGFLALLAPIIALPAQAAPVPAIPHDIKMQIVPHQALYTIKLSAKKSGSPLMDIHGQMLFKWEASCEGWLTDHHFNLHYEYIDQAPLRINSDFSTYEPYDGQSFHFATRRMRNNELYEEIRGRAQQKPGKKGHAHYSLPAGKTQDLPAGNLFPVAHTLAVLDKMNSGARFFSATIFDGSDTDGPVEINSFIGDYAGTADLLARAAAKDALDRDLLAVPARHIRMAFFPAKTKAASPEYEMAAIFHENGIISDIKIEYQDFSVTQKLAALKELPRPACPAQSPAK